MYAGGMNNETIEHLIIRGILAKTVRVPEVGVLIINRVRWAVVVDDQGVPVENAALRAALAGAVAKPGDAG